MNGFFRIRHLERTDIQRDESDEIEAPGRRFVFIFDGH